MITTCISHWRTVARTLFAVVLALSFLVLPAPATEARAPLGPSANRLLGQSNFTFKAVNQGGPASASSLNQPQGVSIASDGRLYVADTGNNRVLSWPNINALEIGADADLVIGQPNFTTNTAGTSQSQLDSPSDVGTDSQGTLYVADRGNSRVLAFDTPTSDGVADREFIGFSQPEGLMIDPAGRLFVADANRHCVRVFSTPSTSTSSATQSIGSCSTTGAEPTAINRLNKPSDIAFDGANILYIADAGNNRVLRFNNVAAARFDLNLAAAQVFGQPNFTSNTPGSGTTNLKNPKGVAVDAAGRLFVADSGNHRIARFKNPADNATIDALFGQATTLLISPIPPVVPSSPSLPNRGREFPDATTLANPGHLSLQGTSLFTADTANNRVLGYAINVQDRAALTLNVNTVQDASDLAPGNGVCATTNNTCSLRAAIQEANASATSDTINVPAGSYKLSLALAAGGGGLDITDPAGVNIGGTNAIVDAANANIASDDSIVEVRLGGKATIAGVSFQSGTNTIINNDGNLTLANGTISENILSAGGATVRSRGAIAINTMTIRNNQSNPLALSNSVSPTSSSAAINNSLIKDNTGSVTSSGVRTTINNTAITNNQIGVSSNNAITITNSLINGNRSGGVLLQGGTARLTMINSTVSGNSGATVAPVVVGFGGLSIGGGRVLLANVTIVGNTGSSSGGLVSGAGSEVRIRNSIIAQNTAGFPTFPPDCSGALISEGFNLFGSANGCTLTGDTATNIVNPNPQLGALANNGGVTQTHAPLAGSALIDTGNLAGCTDAAGAVLTLDQRGFARPFDGNSDGQARCDIGAVEFGSTQSGTGTSTLTSSTGIVKAGEPLTLTLKWVHPVNWRQLNTLDLQLTSGDQSVGVRFSESSEFSSTLSLLDAGGNELEFGVPGEQLVIENDLAEFDVQRSSFVTGGPTGPDVTISFVVRFKQAAGGRTFRVDAIATDDNGGRDVDAGAGGVAVGPFTLFAPLTTR